MVSENFDPLFKPKWELSYKLGGAKVLWGYVNTIKWTILETTEIYIHSIYTEVARERTNCYERI